MKNNGKVCFFKEPNGDYLFVELWNGVLRMWEGRAAVAAGSLGCTSTFISPEYLATCTEVPKEEVPVEWVKALVMEG